MKSIAMSFIFFVSFLFPYFASGWDGYDYEKGSFIEIEEGNLVREGENIEIFDYGTGEYKDVEVEEIERTGDTVEIEVYDYETGEISTIEMDDN